MAQSEREYLASLTPPLAIPGARGRFSKAAKAELVRARSAGMTFTDGKVSVTISDGEIVDREREPVVYPPIKSNPKIRDITSIQGYTSERHLVSSGVCFRCCENVARCHCHSGIHPSSIVVEWADDESKHYGIDLPALA